MRSPNEALHLLGGRCAPPPVGCGRPVDPHMEDTAYFTWARTGKCQRCQRPDRIQSPCHECGTIDPLHHAIDCTWYADERSEDRVEPMRHSVVSMINDYFPELHATRDAPLVDAVITVVAHQLTIEAT